eukprot:5319416-Amphidinium_carterae.1
MVMMILHARSISRFKPQSTCVRAHWYSRQHLTHFVLAPKAESDRNQRMLETLNEKARSLRAEVGEVDAASDTMFVIGIALNTVLFIALASFPSGDLEL